MVATTDQQAPSATEARIARASAKVLSRHVDRDAPLTLRLSDQGSELSFELPPRAVSLLVEMLESMAAEKRVMVFAEDSEITTSVAADILNVSRPFVVKLLDDGVIPCRKVGSHRRVRLDDLMAFKQQDDAEREEAFNELIRLSEEMGLYDRE